MQQANWFYFVESDLFPESCHSVPELPRRRAPRVGAPATGNSHRKVLARSYQAGRLLEGEIIDVLPPNHIRTAVRVAGRR